MHRLYETSLSLDNITKAIETGAAPETLVKRMVELEKEKKTLEGELKRQEKGVVYLDKEQVIFWLEQFKNGNIEDEDFRRQLIDLFVNSVTVWDEPDDYFKITIAYNLTSLQDKTYRLPKGGTLSDFASNALAAEYEIISEEIRRAEAQIKERADHSRRIEVFLRMLMEREECESFDPYTFVTMVEKVVIGRNRKLEICFRNGMAYA